MPIELVPHSGPSHSYHRKAWYVGRCRLVLDHENTSGGTAAFETLKDHDCANIDIAFKIQPFVSADYALPLLTKIVDLAWMARYLEQQQGRGAASYLVHGTERIQYLFQTNMRLAVRRAESRTPPLLGSEQPTICIAYLQGWEVQSSTFFHHTWILASL